MSGPEQVHGLGKQHQRDRAAVGSVAEVSAVPARAHAACRLLVGAAQVQVTGMAVEADPADQSCRGSAAGHAELIDESGARMSAGNVQAV